MFGRLPTHSSLPLIALGPGLASRHKIFANRDCYSLGSIPPTSSPDVKSHFSQPLSDPCLVAQVNSPNVGFLWRANRQEKVELSAPDRAWQVVQGAQPDVDTTPH